MPQRIKLTQDVVMMVGGAYTIALSGSVIDIPDGTKIAAKHADPVAETPGTLLIHGSGGRQIPTPVRGVRTK